DIVLDSAPPPATLDIEELTLREDDAGSYVLSGQAMAGAEVRIELSAETGDTTTYFASADENGRFRVQVDAAGLNQAVVSATVTVIGASGADSVPVTASLNVIEGEPAVIIDGVQSGGAADADEII